MRVAFYTLGCKVNQFESSALAQGFRENGIEVVPFGQEADIYVVNTCAVTAKAAYQSRQILRRITREHPDARLVATGCYVQVGAQEILDGVPGCLCLVGNDQKAELVEIALEDEQCMELYIGDIAKAAAIAPFLVKRPLGRTRAFVRIQDGCNSFCSYCIVPYARGRSRSLSPELVLRQTSVLDGEGIREVVLTGIHVGQYGADLPGQPSLRDLLADLCARFPSMRFRLSSLEPTELTADLLSWASSTFNFCPHWHIPLQSGSDPVLARMNRRYTAAEYRERVMEIHDSMPKAAIGADVLVGFPGEKEADFLATLEFLHDLPITYVHAFPYSLRPGTLAGAMGDTVPKGEKARRVKEIRALGQEKRKRFHHNQLGTLHQCLIEQRDRTSGLWRGTTANYIPLLLEDSSGLDDMANRIVPVRITRLGRGMVYGRPEDDGAVSSPRTQKE